MAEKVMVPLAAGWRGVWIDGRTARVMDVPALVWDPETESAYAVVFDVGCWNVADDGSYRPPAHWLGPGDADEDAIDFLTVETVVRERH